MDFRSVILQDFWVHFAGLIVIAIGLVDLWNFRTFSHDTDLLFIVGGVAGMGLKIMNGSTAAVRTAALDAAFSAARVAGMAAAATAAAQSAPIVTIPVAVTAIPAPAPAPAQPASSGG